jgi:hypothetical protein
MERILVHTNFNNTAKRIVAITYDDLLTPNGLKQLSAIFFDTESFRTPQTTEQVTEEAARGFAHLADLLRDSGADPQQAAHFLIRLLFCLFAEDIGLLPQHLFTQLVRNTRDEPLAFKEQLSVLFRAMASGLWFGGNRIRNFDGRLFDDDTTLELNREGMDILLRASALDWSNIEPSILGTLFERSLDPTKRSQIGAHYTSKEDILLVVEPVLMKPLRRKWESIQQQAVVIAKSRDAASSRATRTKYDKELASLLMGFAQELAQVQVLDPACGSGNFLYVALKQLLGLEKEVVTLGSRLSLSRFFPSVSPAQLHGIEINQYAHELAQATIWIGYIQWLHDNGFGKPTEPILKPIETILHMDAILGHGEDGLPTDPAWPKADVIIGNPPFLGSRKMRPAFGKEYCDSLERAYKGRIKGQPDLVCYWFEKARASIAQHEVKRVGLLATQAIRGGTNRRVLDHIRAQGNIFMAWRDRGWILDGAKVHVSIIGFDDGSEQDVMLDGEPATHINPDLNTDIDVTTAYVLKDNSGLCFEGDVLWGRFNISASEAHRMMASTGNPNGRPNTDVIKRRCAGEDITERTPKSYVIDFGVDMSLEDASAYVEPFEFIKTYVYPERAGATDESAKERWWLHWRPRPEMRIALASLPRYILTPRVSKHRVFVWADNDTLADSATVAIARADDYFFGVLHSKVHELWARRKGTQLRDRVSGFRYTPKTTYRTFPFPWAPGTESESSQRPSQKTRCLVESSRLP